MKLYVHYEGESEAEAWTKRVTLPVAPAASVRDVLGVFLAAYAAKFSRAFPLAPDELDVFIDGGPSAAHRRRVEHLDVPVQLAAGALAAAAGGALELVVARKPRVLAPARGPAENTSRLLSILRSVGGIPDGLDQSKAQAPTPKPTDKPPAERESADDAESEDDSRDPALRSVLELAAAQMKQQKFRAARELHETVVLAAEPLNPEALLALGDILLANGRYEDAAKRYFLKCWRAHGLARTSYDEMGLGVTAAGSGMGAKPTAAKLDSKLLETLCTSIKAKAKAPALRPAASKAYARLAFTCALRLAGCYIETKKYMKAVEILDELQVFLRSNSEPAAPPTTTTKRKKKPKLKVFFPDTKERDWMESQMDVLRARALYETKSPEHQERAIALVMHMLPDLQAPLVNLDALLLYARIAHDRGKKSEALSMALRVLVGKSNDTAVKKTLVYLLKAPGAMERLQSAVPASSQSSGAAYAFIATILKDFGALEPCVRCFQQARLSDPSSASYVLNLSHALEVGHQYERAYDVLVEFLQANTWASVGVGIGAACLTAGTILKVLDELDAWNMPEKYPIQDVEIVVDEGDDQPATVVQARVPRVEWVDEHGGFARVILQGTRKKDKGKEVVTVPTAANIVDNKRLPLLDNELDLLACYFTIVKLLFLKGRVAALPRLVALLEPIRVGRELHRTTIRNEQAYYTCIAHLLTVDKPPMRVMPPNRDGDVEDIYVCGDSHTLATAWRELSLTFDNPSSEVNSRRVLLRPALVTGLKHWHLRKESTFYPKINFWRVLAAIPPRSRVIFLFGEIDCREGILSAVEKCKYEVRN